MESERVILLADMNAFFASVEQQNNPALKGRPVLVAGAPNTRTVVAAASYEARTFGIRSAMPLMQALDLCPEAVVVTGNLEKYTYTAQQVFRIFMSYTDLVEIYSIDECFLDVTGTQHMFGGAWGIARSIKRDLRAELGLTCSIGIAPNKMLAKLASGMQKPDGLTEIKKEEIRGLLEDLPVEKLHGIGDKLQVRLARFGIRTAGELGRASRDRLKREFGIVGEILNDMGKGIDRSPIVPYYEQPDAKSVGHSYTLIRNTRDIDLINRHLLRLSEMVGRRLREKDYSGRTVTLVLRYADMHGFCKQKSLPEHLDDGYAIYKVASSIFDQQLHDKRAIRLVGVCVSNLVRGMRQMNLFDDPREKAVVSVMDAINDRYGEFAIRRASLLNIDSIPKTHGFAGKQVE